MGSSPKMRLLQQQTRGIQAGWLSQKIVEREAHQRFDPAQKRRVRQLGSGHVACTRLAEGASGGY